MARGSISPFVCQAQHKFPRSAGSVSLPVTSRVLNWAARTLFPNHQAACVQRNEPGVEPLKLGIGVDINLSIFMLVADLDRTGNASPRWSVAPSLTSSEFKSVPPQGCGDVFEFCVIYFAPHRRRLGPHGLQCFPTVGQEAGEHMNMDVRHFLSCKRTIVDADGEILGFKVD